MATTRKQQKLANYINHRMRVDIKDGRQIVGQMLGFDRHMNLVLVDAEELRKTKRKVKGESNFVETEEKRNLGMLILRGAEVVACVADGAPPADPSARLGTDKATTGVPAATVTAAPGISRPAGRGAGLQGPAAGVGGPAFGGFPGGPPAFGGPPGFGRGFPPPGAPGFGFQGGPPPFPPGGRGAPNRPGFPGR